jgi:hypothetical protein
MKHLSIQLLSLLYIVGALLGNTHAAPEVFIDLIEPFPMQIVVNGTLTTEFSDMVALGAGGAEILGIRDFTVTFGVSAPGTPYSYAFSLQKAPSSASSDYWTFPTTGNIGSESQNVSITVECAETAAVVYHFFLALVGPDGVEIITFPFVKQCNAPGTTFLPIIPHHFILHNANKIFFSRF